MRGYQAKMERQRSDGAEPRGDAHAARADLEAHTGFNAEPLNGSSKTASLMQLQAALDQSPSVRSQLALQRALDQRAAAGGQGAAKKKPAPGKPALQKKGIAINDDAGLEREADVQGQKALTVAAATRRIQAPLQLHAVVQFGGKFIGVESAIHLHIGIAKPHLKLGGQGDRYDIAGGGGQYANKRLRDALDALEGGNYENVAGYKACRDWLYAQLGEKPKDEKDDKKADTKVASGGGNSNKKKAGYESAAAGGYGAAGSQYSDTKKKTAAPAAAPKGHASASKGSGSKASANK